MLFATWIGFSSLQPTRSGFRSQESKILIGSGTEDHGLVAQLGERWLCKPNVAGSIPVESTQFVDVAGRSEAWYRA